MKLTARSCVQLNMKLRTNGRIPKLRSSRAFHVNTLRLTLEWGYTFRSRAHAQDSKEALHCAILRNTWFYFLILPVDKLHTFFDIANSIIHTCRRNISQKQYAVDVFLGENKRCVDI